MDVSWLIGGSVNLDEGTVVDTGEDATDMAIPDL
jgi:hypothetical protein